MSEFLKEKSSQFIAITIVSIEMQCVIVARSYLRMAKK